MENKLNQLALEFFILFSRMEYSLKAAGFHFGPGNAKPNWRKFAESLEAEFLAPSSDEFSEAVEYIGSNPPKMQMIKDDKLEWRDVPPCTDLKSDLVLLYVRRVRNNLFHGGKFNGYWFAPERSDVLLRNSILILNHCKAVSDKVLEAYEN